MDRVEGGKMHILPRTLAFIFLVTIVGCGEPAIPTYVVKGKILYASQTVPTGMVQFLGNGTAANVSATIAEDGSYELRAPAGSYRIGIIAPRSPETKPTSSGGWQSQMSVKMPPPYVPAAFNDPERSGLTAEVQALEINEIDVEIPKLKRRRRR